MKGLRGVLVLAALVPNLSMAMPSKCELQARSKFQKQAVEIEMASITGNVSAIEVVSRRESLQKRLEREQAHCIRPANTRRYASSGVAEISF